MATSVPDLTIGLADGDSARCAGPPATLGAGPRAAPGRAQCEATRVVADDRLRGPSIRSVTRGQRRSSGGAGTVSGQAG